MQRLLVSTAAAVLLLVFAPSAHAYLHVNNAIAKCQNMSAADIPNHIAGASWGGHTDVARWSDRDVNVRVRWFGGGLARFYDCRFIADDGPYGGMKNISYQWVYVAGPYFANVSSGCWQPCYYFNGAYPN